MLPRLYGRRPLVHQAAPTLEEITARIGRRCRVLYRVGERGLGHLAVYACPFRGLIPEARLEPMRHGGDAEFLDQFRQIASCWRVASREDCGTPGRRDRLVSVRHTESGAPAPRPGRGDPASRSCARRGWSIRPLHAEEPSSVPSRQDKVRWSLGAERDRAECCS